MRQLLLNWSTMYYGQWKEKKVTVPIAIDLSTAFDTVDHDILISVLQTKFGVKDKALDWYKSYLNDRTCKVNVGKEYSTPRELLFSVPQGSCSRPVLYLSYCSTIREVIPNNTISLHGFADDHCTAHTIALGLTISHLDYANSLLIGLPDCNIDRMQNVQNATARLGVQDETLTTKECLKKLHWLPVKSRIVFKVATLVYRCLSKMTPKYLQDLIALNPIRNKALDPNSDYKN